MALAYPDPAAAGTLNASSPADVTIPDNGSSVNSAVTMGGAPGGAAISNVKVYYEIKHTNIGDLKVWLTTYYEGTWHDYIIRDRVGGNADDIAETIDNITVWNGASPNQTWYLVAKDLASGHTGYIDYFELWVDYSNTGAPPLSLNGRVAYHSYSDYMAAPAGDGVDGHLHVYRADTDTLESVTTGLPVQNAMNPHFSPDGAALVFMALPAGVPRSLSFLEVYSLDLATSTLTRLTSNSVADEDPKYSPDGSMIVWKRQGQVWAMNADGTTPTQLTFTADEKSGPNYSPDGSRIVYWSQAGSNADVWWMSSNGSGPGEIVGNANIQDYYPIYRDADNILYSRWESSSDRHDKIYNYDIGSGTSSRLALNAAGVEDADAAPVNASNLVFCSTRGGGEGSYDIYVGRYDNDVVYSLPAANSTHKDLGPSYSPYTYARAAVLEAPANGSDHTAGSSVLLTVSLYHEGGIWPGADPKVVFSGPVTNEYTGLTDDGTQGDAAAGDGIYSKTVTLPAADGSYTVHAEATSAEPGVTRQVLSSSAAVTLFPALDTSPPLPNPMTWELWPYATNATSIRMVASAATDASGVEYYFEETSGNSGGSDSTWQSSPVYVDTGLTPNETYSYRARARDQSANQNAGSFTDIGMASTDGDYDGDAMPDWWEILHFGTPENGVATNNADYDAHDNLGEYVSGTDPKDSNSVYAVTLLATPPGVTLEWSGMTGRWYEVLWTPSLTNTYQSLEDFITLPQESYTDTNHNANPAGFYKVEVRMQE
jgi:subtilisin-like proprotein convertase family protein